MAVAGAGRLTKTGQTTLALTSNTSNFTGGFLINQGRVNLNANNAAGTGAFFFKPSAPGAQVIGISTGTTVTVPNNIELTSTGTGSTNYDVNTGQTLAITGIISGTSDVSRRTDRRQYGPLVPSDASNSSIGATQIPVGILNLGIAASFPIPLR